MAFNSFSFWFVFPIIFGLYWLIPNKYNRWRKIFLIAVSYLLYMNWKPVFALVLLGVTLVTWWGGLVLSFDSGRKNITSETDVQKFKNNREKKLAWLFALLGMLPLLLFKYYNFLNESLTALLEFLGVKFQLPGLNWAVPVGISFFTFQAVGYMLDVYHGRVKPERNLLNYVLFVSFFPQVLSGPISTAENLIPQIEALKKFDYEQGRQGLKLLLWGMFIKLVIADRLGLIVDTVYANYEHYNGATCFVASVFYTLQIYCDFAGYSFMAIGIAKTLGFDLTDNFRRPYFALSITDFWKRWHISLTRWLTRQVYIPLGGNRCSKVKNYWNIMITFLVSGVWHGANWTFIFWGAIHGVLQIAEKSLGWQKYEGNNLSIRIVRISVTFLLVNFAWIFFRMPNISDAFTMIGTMVTNFGMPSLLDFGKQALLIPAIGLSILAFKELRDEFFHQRLVFLEKAVVRWAVYIVLFCMILNFGVLDGGQFIYVSF